MLKSALALVSSLQIGASLKDAVQRQLMKAAVVAVAALFLIGGGVFGMMAGYGALLNAGYTPVQAAGIFAAGLVLISMFVLACLPLLERKKKRSSMASAFTGGSTKMSGGSVPPVGMLDQQVGRMVQQVGPVSLLAAAFAIGLAAGRSRDRS